MRFNTIGDYCGGIASQVSVNGRYLAVGGGTRFYSDDVVLANSQLSDGGWVLCQFRRATGWKQESMGKPVTNIGAGGNNYAATLESQPDASTFGLFNGSPLSSDYAKYHVLDGFHDGTLLFATPNWNFLTVLHGDDGTAQSLLLPTNALVPSIRLIEGGVCYSTTSGVMYYSLWDDPGWMKVYTVGFAFSPFMYKVDDQWWVLYHNDFTYLHPLGDVNGYKFPPADNVDIWIGNDGKGKIVGGLDQGEVQQAVYPVDLSLPRTLLETPIDTTIKPFSHYVHAGPYFATGQYGNVDTPGNCEILIRANWADMARKRPVFADLASYSTVPEGMLLGIFVGFEGENVDATAYQMALNAAKKRNVPLLVYWDGPEYPVSILDQFVNEPNIIPVYQCYPRKVNGQTEPINDTILRWRRNLLYLSGRYPRVGISHTMYTQTGNYTLREILALQQPIGKLIEDHAIFSDLWFAWLRDPSNSIAGNPELIQAAHNFADAVVSTDVPPIMLPVADTEAPTVYFTHPHQNDVLGGIVTLLVEAIDNKGIASVTFYVDGMEITTDTGYPYVTQIDTKALPNGTHLLQAIAKDTSNNTSRTSISILTWNPPDVPPVPSVIPQARILENHMKGYLRYQKKYMGVSPGSSTVYHDRDAGGAWEEVELVKLNDRGEFSVHFLSANKFLSQGLDGKFSTRDAGGGAWETFFAVASPVGSSKAYNMVLRLEGDNMLLPVMEFIEKT